MRINRSIIDQVNIDPGGVIITVPRNNCDFVSIFFTSRASIFEDPVTGSAHCSLIALWRRRLNKKKLVAFNSLKGLANYFATTKVNAFLSLVTQRRFLLGAIV